MKRLHRLTRPAIFRSLHPRLARRAAAFCAVAAITALGLGTDAAAGDRKSPSLTSTHGPLHWLQTGRASWYGLSLQGHRTSSGEKFDMNGLTCAHRSLPLGSWVRVTNLRNSRSVLVRVNDRGPVSHSRVIDLSFAAARAVGLDGIGNVRLEPISPANPELAQALLAQLHPPTMPSLVPAS